MLYPSHSYLAGKTRKFFMLAFIITLILIWLAMWAFFKFMYPKPPKEFMPKKGDVITPRECDFCGYPLAEYRGVMEAKPETLLMATDQQRKNELTSEIAALEHQIATYEKQASDKAYQKQLTRQQKKQAQSAYDDHQKQLFEKKQALKKVTTWFFCNYEHQADFHARNAEQITPTIVK